MLRVPGDTTPTWELEMLVSGAVLVGLVQVAPVIDEAWSGLLPRLATRAASMAGGLAYALVKGSLYALLVTFVVHLAARAYWVALVGLDSVFPGGIRWDRFSARGGVTAEEVKRLVRPLPTVISRLDNFCSVLFAIGFLAVAFAVAVLAVMGAAAGLVWLASVTVLRGYRISPGVAIGALWLVLFLPRVLYVVAWRIAPEGRVTAALRSASRLGVGMLILRLFGSLSLTLMTNIRRRGVLASVFVLLALSVSVAFSQMLASRGDGDVVLYPGMPGSLGTAALEYRYYADQRLGSDARLPLPFIQSDVVRDPYVRLFIPYVPRRDGTELRACRAEQPRSGGSTPAPDEAALTLRCLARIHAVTVNGRASAGLTFRFYTDAGSGLEGILTYIPVAGLPRGPNVLSVRRPAASDETRGSPGWYSIPFWL